MADEEKTAVMDDDLQAEREEQVEIDDDGNDDDVEGVMRDAVAAVEQVKGRKETAAEAAAEAAAEEVEKLRQEVDELRDRSVRTLAELDNFRKRAEREKQEIRRYALLEPMRDFLDVVDNLERAMAASGSFEDLKTGVEMILRQMQDLLRQHGVERVEAEGQPFDPNLHEAVTRVEDSDVELPQVMRELQRGYVIHDRLLRPARVQVAVPVEEESDGATDDEPGNGVGGAPA